VILSTLLFFTIIQNPTSASSMKKYLTSTVIYYTPFEGKGNERMDQGDFRSFAFIATITVLSDISTAPIAGEIIIPSL